MFHTLYIIVDCAMRITPTTEAGSRTVSNIPLLTYIHMYTMTPSRQKIIMRLPDGLRMIQDMAVGYVSRLEGAKGCPNFTISDDLNLSQTPSEQGLETNSQIVIPVEKIRSPFLVCSIGILFYLGRYQVIIPSRQTRKTTTLSDRRDR